jgi:hypothetical protein
MTKKGRRLHRQENLQLTTPATTKEKKRIPRLNFFDLFKNNRNAGQSDFIDMNRFAHLLGIVNFMISTTDIN